ncbi:YbhB/YbcL family Raf kinase inhibitor-like protein [Pediococcus stilesii]|uniref:Phosphatidylethanolamine-binding protein n=1 Tax=Pediococcus stilesii TaxID=331679 RepID=A0A0R2KVY9_9LACO|nr:YbhB/YbcL family Raf kinase inhibitor-like protein [Pediococcus stilesii]KRN93699.1 phosphatidylethanolamine-binding protein [Pediococcus stilesii]
MKINVDLLGGFLPDRFGKYAPEEYRLHNQPMRSFPIHISDLPRGTRALALTLIDYDAVPVAGFPWIHWIATDFDVSNEIPENISNLGNGLVQGKNSNDSKFIDLDDPVVINHYVGPTPPSDHDYTLTVYALNNKTNLEPGFYLNELLKKVDSMAIDQATIKFRSRG